MKRLERSSIQITIQLFFLWSRRAACFNQNAPYRASDGNWCRGGHLKSPVQRIQQSISMIHAAEEVWAAFIFQLIFQFIFQLLQSCWHRTYSSYGGRYSAREKVRSLPLRWRSLRNLDIRQAYIWDYHGSSATNVVISPPTPIPEGEHERDNERKATCPWRSPTSPPPGYSKRPSVVSEVTSESDAKFQFFGSGWIKPTETLKTGGQ